MKNDGDLRRRFKDLCREDATRAGDFHAFLGRYRARRVPRRIFRWIAVAAVLATIIVLVGRWPRRRVAETAAISITQWKSPTDFLLHTPGEEVWRTVPTIGEWPAQTETPREGRRPPEIRKKNPSKLPTEENQL